MAGNRQTEGDQLLLPPVVSQSEGRESRICPLCSWRHNSGGASLFDIGPQPPQEQAVAAGRSTQDQARGAAPNTNGQREREIQPLAHVSEKYLQFFTLKHPAFLINTDNSQTGDSQLTQTQYY